MSDDQNRVHQKLPPLSAAELRDKITERKNQSLRERSEKFGEGRESLQAAYQEFMDRQFTEIDQLRIRSAVETAAENGLFEVIILTFPSSYLEDRGRRINNADADWNKHLSGYAEKVCTAYEDFGQPHGFKLFARILNYPDGKIGEVGFFLSWKS